VLLEGRLTLKLDDGEVKLSPGDVVVQRDTNHAWRAGDQPARCFVVISYPAVAA
jgi:quercetin dioxygenase-like cupin family protein